MAALDSFLPRVYLLCPGVPRELAERELLRCARAFCQKTQLLRRTLAVAAEAGEAVVTLPAAEGLGVVQVRGVEIVGLGYLEPVLESALDAGPAGWADETGMPRRFFCPEPDRIRVLPTPAAPMVLRVTAVVAPTLAATSLPDRLLEDYGAAMEAGTAAALLLLPGQPWSNPEAAAAESALYHDGVGRALQRVANGHGVGAARVRPRRL